MPTTSDRDPTPPQAILLGTSKLRADGVFVQVSEALAQLSGWSVEGLTDRPLHTILHLSAAEQDALMWALGKATPVVRELAVGSDRASLSWIRATFVRVREPSDPEPLLWMIAEDISARRAQARDHRDQIEALHRTQATVELDLQGTILRANERFLELMGYTEAQVVGQPHRMLVPPEEANSHSYRDFWRRLREGQPQSGQFERVGARSTPIFLQASYTPIRDISGQVYKVVKYASDITQQTLQLRESQESAERYSAEMARVVDALKRGELSVRGDVESQGRTHQAAIAQLNEGLEAIAAPITECLDSLRAMAEGRSPPLPSADHEGDFKLLADSVRTLSQSTSRVAQIASQIADGDLTIKVERRSEEDVLMGALGRMVAALNALLRQVQGSSHQLDQGSAQVQEASQSLANNASRSAASLEEISASMEEISVQTGENAKNATSAMELSTRARESAALGDQQMGHMVSAMKGIDESARSISKIIKVIDDIAFQTNLLALNAAVEAGRAGVHGRGFAVVAEEVRRLAGRSAQAAKETTELIEGSSRKVNQGLDIAKATATSLSVIVTSVGEVSDLVGEIAAASQEQASGISEINDALSQVDSVTQQNTAKAEEMAAASRELSSNSATLTQLLSRFRLAEAPAPARPTLTPEMMSALQLFMTQRGLHTASRGASPREQASTNGLGYNPPLNDPDFGDF